MNPIDKFLEKVHSRIEIFANIVLILAWFYLVWIIVVILLTK